MLRPFLSLGDGRTDFMQFVAGKKILLFPSGFFRQRLGGFLSLQ